MFDTAAPKDFRQTETRVTRFIITRFSDPVPGYPLSVTELEKIFDKKFLSSLFGFYTQIANELRPNKKGLRFLLSNQKINIKSIYSLVGVLRHYLRGLEVSLKDIEEMHLPYDFVPTYTKTEDYRQIQLIYTIMEKIVNYSES